jgi:hypothetical protein
VFTHPRHDRNRDIATEQARECGHPIAWGTIASLTATVLLSMSVLVLLIATL